MGLYNPDIEKNPAMEQKRADYDQRRHSDFTASPVEQARAAKSEGKKIFRINLPIMKKRGFVAMFDAHAKTKPQEYSNVIQSIEKEGWCFDRVDFVYHIIGSVRQDKAMADGTEKAVSTEIVGVHIFYSNTTN